MRRLRIVSNGPTSAYVSVQDADTGEVIEGVVSVDIALRVQDWNTATIVVSGVELDVEVDAEVPERSAS